MALKDFIIARGNDHSVREQITGFLNGLSARLGGPDNPEGPPVYDAINMRWVKGGGKGEQRYQGDTVFLDLWTMIANKDTLDYAAPQPTGAPFDIFDGTLVPSALLAKQIFFGNRYTFDRDGYIIGYRIYVNVGQSYRIFIVIDPGGLGEVQEIIDFTADNTGWEEFSVTPVIVRAGEPLDLIAEVAEPDPSPVTFDGPWNYLTPQNPAVPAAGEIEHSRSEPYDMRINYTDNNAVDRSVELKALDIGDTIEGGGVTWTVQSNTDQGTYALMGVSPAVNLGVIGILTFTFSTIVETPITIDWDTDYWLSNPNVQGLVGVGIPYDLIIPNENAYGTDLKMQEALISHDWDTVSAP